MTKSVKSIGIKSYTYDPIKIYAYGEENNDNPEYNVHIGNYTSISQNCKIITYEGHHHYTNGSTFPFYQINSKSNGDVIIGSDVWIGRDVTIMSGVTIGDGAVIAANSHVVKDVEPYSIYGGNPAKFIKYRFDKELIDKFLELKWWNYPEHNVELIIPYLQQEATLDTFLNIKRILTEIGNMTKLEEINRLYKLILGRDADASGLNHYLNSGLNLYQIQIALWQSDEFKNRFNHINAIETSTIDSKIPIFVINLERRPDRKAQVQSRLNNLGIHNYTIVNAVDGSKLTTDQIANDYNDAKSREIHRSMTPSEIACALSHIECAKKILNDNLDYAIILEDDVELTLDFKQFLKDFDINKNYGFDFLILGAFSSNQFFNGKLKTKQAPHILVEKESIIYLDKKQHDIGNVSIHESHYPTKQLDYVHGTHAYVMSKAGAKKLLEINYPVIVEADNIWNYFPELCQIQFTNPIVCHRQHLDSDIHTDRIGLVKDDKNFSAEFLTRKAHQDFGT